ncbi:hypothetical protein M409DRAFT_63761 [Zasmidium cellare ATCC 36951]|uniref:NAD dependent epimerase/dehydratase n=1 Tax=Zasmidium cellare ATCC 36951 TaxID=1080233 RepID=A0A6A6CWX1_ZASCE|nr:uncharacterized protein M409DRAFT_63761 [Zasmidium cellare ATCC 36951]KAF2171525.1 hypothetical protein M409DRAFT_63761 [Zasmidium cellare ATCC 36951]
MGAEASKPMPGAQLRVIGAGLPRTGTASFTAALSILLGGPVYHSGTQMLVSGDEKHIKTQIRILEHTPMQSPEDKKVVMEGLKSLVNGYVATADSSMCQFVPELLELFPDAKVICTTRDPDAWAKSMGELASTSLQNMLALMLFWVPCLRLFPKWVRVLHEGRWGELYIRPGEQANYGQVTWERHVSWLQESVPKDRLVFYDVRDGWQPLCDVLGVPVPRDTEFPRMNDSDAMSKFAAKQIANGVLRWLIVVVVGAGIMGFMWQHI